MTLKIQGVLGVSVNKNGTQYLLTPAAAYLSPDKKSAVLYGDGGNAKQVLLVGSSLVLTLCSDFQSKEYLLMQLALQQRPVELNVDNSNKITGFTYPAPKP